MAKKSYRNFDVLQQADKFQDKIQIIIDWMFKNVKPIYMFLALLALHWFSTSGQVFNMINNAPPYNIVPDRFGKEHLEILAKGSHNQYTFEGTIAGLLTCLAPLFYIIALRKMHTNEDLLHIIMWLMLGTAAVFLIHFMYISKN